MIFIPFVLPIYFVVRHLTFSMPFFSFNSCDFMSLCVIYRIFIDVCANTMWLLVSVVYEAKRTMVSIQKIDFTHTNTHSHTHDNRFVHPGNTKKKLSMRQMKITSKSMTYLYNMPVLNSNNVLYIPFRSSIISHLNRISACKLSKQKL